MTKQQLIAGDKFAYDGHFQLLAREVSLRLHDGYLVDQYNDRFAFLMGEPTATYFVVWKAGYGSFPLQFSDCKIKTDEYA